MYTLPCKYCRKSFKKFLKELPIDNHLDSRDSLTYWLYLIHDKVNKKLIKQEAKALQERLADITRKRKTGKLSNAQYHYRINKAKKTCLFTKPSLPYEQFCRHFESKRAKCAKVRGHIPSCRLPPDKLKKFKKSSR